MDNKIKITIWLKNGKSFVLGDSIEGEILLNAEEDVEAVEFGYRVVTEVRGQMEPRRHVYKEKKIIVNSKISGGKRHVYPFSFVYDDLENYSGQTFRFLVMIEVFLSYPKANEADDFFDKLNPGRFIYPNHELLRVEYLTIKNPNENLRASGNKIQLVLKLLGFSKRYSFSFLVIGFIISRIIDFPLVKSLIFLFGVLGLLLFGIDLLKSYLGTITVNFETNESDGFILAKIENDKRWIQIKSLTVRLRQLEKVLDRRGTDVVIRIEEVGGTAPQEFRRPRGVVKMPVNFSEINFPTTSFGDGAVLWEIEVTALTTFGAKIKLWEGFDILRVR